MKKTFTLLLISITINLVAQIPTYVPTNGLVGYWPFTGNANDISGNGNNGTVNGAILATDRFGASNKTYSFDGTNDTIKTTYVQTNITSMSISAWFKTTTGGAIVGGDHNSNCISLAVGKQPYDGINTGKITFRADGPAIAIGQITDNTYLDNNWHHVVGIYSGTAGLINDGQFQIYVDNVLASSTAMATGGLTAPLNDSLPTIFGAHYNWSPSVFNGLLDDIGIWNRALTTQEISNLYNATNNCNLINNIILTSVSSGGQNIWSTGDTANTISLNPSTVPFVWVSDGTCIDTIFFNSLSATIYDTTFITITDTNFVTITDTTFITVMDTLVINALLTGLIPPNNINVIKVFPNPTNDHITIDYGNFNLMSGYTLKIENAIGQTVFTTAITQQLSYIDLSTWSGNGIYFVHVIDNLNNTIDIRKIVLQ
ncbi:MAG TPA: T9SS type A sorting domain-containing protein [Bacteroidia bacterium]|nr:T9SS type A sorting domain-containing protein [Bacteroidia bacterium]